MAFSLAQEPSKPSQKAPSTEEDAEFSFRTAEVSKGTTGVITACQPPHFRDL